ncbi:MAG: alternative ribosome rescue aminoacyl-tRNA hydrolase ArfB [Polyangiaceae bacterium]
MNFDLVVSARLTIPGSELDWSAVRASGPGGQNVNKVATKVMLCFDPRSPSLPLAVSLRLLALAKNRLDAEGRLVVSCDETRSQTKNLKLACERLAELIRTALVAPKRRRPTRPSAAMERARLENKRATSNKKRERRRSSWD